MSRIERSADTLGPISGTADQVVESSGLPIEVREVIALTVRATRLWPLERADVARELVAHFRDGLDRGESAADLIARFGEPKAAGKRMGKAARQKRSWFWHVRRRMRQGALILVAGVALVYGALWVRFMTGSPTIARNYAAELNAPVLATPESERAWTVYRPAIIAIQPAMREHDGWDELGKAKPGTPEFEKAQAAVRAFEPHLAVVRRAAAMESLGFLMSDAQDVELALALSPTVEVEPKKASENPKLIEVTLQPLGPMRSVARALALEASTAAATGNGARAAEDIVAMLGMARQCMGMPFLISDLVGIAIGNLAWNTTSDLVVRYPEAFTEGQLEELARAMEGSANHLTIDAATEKDYFEDTLQRIFTDDGHGDGRLTPEGMRYLASLSSFGADHPAGPTLPENLIAPAKMAFSAGRKATRDRYNEMFDVYAKFKIAPMWTWTRLPDAEIVTQSEDNRSVYPVVALLMPALSNVLISENWSRMTCEVAMAGVALERFKRANGRYPTTLDELVPAYLSSVPTDIADGKPIRYILLSGTPRIYSIGMDRVDNQGRPAIEGDAPVRRQGWRDPASIAQWKASGQLPSYLDGDVILWPMSE